MKTMNRYLRPQTRFVFWLWLASGILLVTTAWLGALTYRQHRIMGEVTARNDKLITIQTAAVAPQASRAEQEEQKRWAQLKIEREFSWKPVFLAVEQAASPDIALLEFKPDKLNRRIILRGEAKDSKALIVYLDALAMQSGLSNVYLSHQQTVERGALETIAFEIKATLLA